MPADSLITHATFSVRGTDIYLRCLNALRRLSVAVAAVLVWEAAVRWWLPSFLPKPSGVVTHAASTVTSTGFLQALSQTLGGVGLGLLLGCCAGTALGMVAGRVAWVQSLIAPYVSGLYAMPILAIIPMATLWWGYTANARLAIVGLSAFLPCAVTTADGARVVPIELVELGRALRLPRRRMVVDVLVPSTLPFIVAGLQVAVGRALVGAVAVEFLASLSGIGTFIMINARTFHQDAAFVAVLILAAFGVIARVGTEALLAKLAPWSTRIDR